MTPNVITLLFKEARDAFPPIEGKPTDDDLLLIWETLLPILVEVVGTLQDRYVRNVPLPRVPREQRASPALTAPKAGIPLPGYSRIPAWTPTLPKIGNVFGFSQRLVL